MLLYPNEGRGLTTEFLIGVSRISLFPYFVRQREQDEDSLCRMLVPVFDISRDANVEAAMYPLSYFSQATMDGLA